MKNFVLVSAFCVMLMAAFSPVIAVTHNVPAEFATIQAGLDVSASGDTVLVQPGTYFENLVWPEINGIKLIAAGDESSTFIDGGNADRVMEIISDGAIDATTLIQGFTIQNGIASGVNPNDCGGGIFCYQSSPTINSCTISGNSAEYGGGIDAWASSSPTISNCTISGNEAYSKGGGICGYSFSNCYPTITQCNISGNSAPIGGGIMFRDVSPVISYCTISGNSAELGGGISCQGSSNNTTLSNCNINGNSAPIGGGINCFESSFPTIVNCAVTDNIGEGIYAISYASPEIVYSDFYNNSAGDFAGSVDPGFGVIVGVNDNGDPCDVYFNISLDPMCVDPDNGDFHLMEGSPCIDAGDPDSPLDPDETTADIGACYFNQLSVHEFEANELPSMYSISAAYPNPFNPTTTISVSLPQPADLNVSVFNVNGQHVATLASGTHNAGSHSMTFDASNLASGLFFVRATVPTKLDQVRKIMLVR
jgi:parallel beta-helix repeat protein